MDKFVDPKYAFLFQGVGVEYQSCLHLLNEEQIEMLNHYCSIAYKEVGLDLWNYLFNSSTEKYDKLFSDWIAIYTCDHIVYQTFTDLGIKPEIFLGYSMGLITAMACGKSISYEAGLHMLKIIYEYPQSAAREEEAMAVIVGMTCEDVENIIQSHCLKDCVEVASENNELCIVISGSLIGVEKVMETAEKEGALKVKNVNAPFAFHSHYAGRGIEKLAKFVAQLQVLDSKIPIISSFDQRIIQEAFDLKKELVRNMASRMYWKTSIETIIDMGIESFVEISLDRTITKFSKLINTDCKFLTYTKLVKSKGKAKKVMEKIK
ncbi:MAG: ACP S-malonyltransferase [Halanaerobiales bacterium]|nr:ACP S-malonyltransferase [Halanaerobiales bacterium]